MTTPIRICQVSSDYRAGGGERIARVLASGAKAAGHDSILLTLRGENPDGPSLGCANVYGPMAAVRLYRWLRAWADARPDALHIVHCHMTPCQLHGAVVAGAMRLIQKLSLTHRRQRFGNLIFVTTEHNPWNRRRRCPLFRLLDRWMYGRYAAIFAISTGVETSLREWLGHLPAGSRVIWNGVALPCERVTDRYGQSDPATLRFFSVGRYTEQKNYPRILAALEQLGRPVRYDIFGGDEAGRERLQAAHAAQTAHSSSHVDLHCHGYVDNVWDHVPADGILLLASNWEGFGLVAVEAMNRSYLLVASAVTGLQEVCEQDSQPLAQLCDPQSVESIHAAIAASLQLIATGDYRERIAAAFQRSLDFSEEKMVAEYLVAYEELGRPTS